MAQILGILAFRPETQDMPRRIHDFAEAGRLAFADRDRYVADADFVALPGGSWRSLLEPAYLKRRAAEIGPMSMGRAEPGNPKGAADLADGAMPEVQSTSHVSVVDAEGRAVSLTASVESLFGARITAGGFPLNNQLTDFSFNPRAEGRLVANRVQPGKRPRSAMAPTIVTENGKVKMVVGSAGGPLIINYVARTLLATLDWKLPPEAALEMANFGSRNGPTEVESCRTPTAWAEGLRAMGHEVRLREMVSGTHLILRGEREGRQGWMGVADPRREGAAAGD